MGICGLILAHRPSFIPEDAIRLVIGKRTARTLTEVAAEFGVESTTLRANWRQQGMPGKAGAWPLAEILIWRLKHEAAVAERQPGSSAKSQTVELRDIEIEEKRLNLQRKQRRAALEDGDMVERHRVERELSALIAVLRERLLRIPALIEPMLPADVAVDTRVEMEKQIRRQLVAMSEKSARDVLNSARLLEAD
jgi:hypothetical protein